VVYLSILSGVESVYLSVLPGAESVYPYVLPGAESPRTSCSVHLHALVFSQLSRGKLARVGLTVCLHVPPNSSFPEAS
jgi:hypothetical protein